MLSKQERQVRCQPCQLSASSDVSEFLERKIETLSQGLEYRDEYLEGLRTVLQTGQLTREDFDQESCLVLNVKRKEMRDLVVAKRQRKFIEEDMEEEEGPQNKLEDAYAQRIP